MSKKKTDTKKESSNPGAKLNSPSSMRINKFQGNVKGQSFARIPVNVVRHKV